MSLRPVDDVWKVCRQIVVSLRVRGLRATVEAAVATLGHHWFDVRYGTNTSALVPLSRLMIGSPNKSRGVGYTATKPRLFARLMRAIPTAAGGVFVDFGCGKGRVLLLAAAHGFERVVGVEFSPDLCRIARSNIAAYRRRIRTSTQFEILEIDVCAYQMRDVEKVVFLFNPFDSVILSTVLDKIEASYRRNPRPIWLIYHNPVFRHVVECRETFHAVSDVNYAGAQVRIYATRHSLTDSAGAGPAPGWMPIEDSIR